MQSKAVEVMNVLRSGPRPLSLRGRLIVGVLLLVAVAIGAVATSTYVALQSFLVSRVDRQLAAAPPGLVDEVCTGSRGSHPGSHGTTHGDGPHGPVPMFVSRLDPDGLPDPTCPPTGSSYALHLSAADAALLAQHVMRPVELHRPGGAILAMARPTRGQEGPGTGDVTGAAGPNRAKPDGGSNRAGPEGGSPPGGPGGAMDDARDGALAGGLDVVALSMDDVQATLDRLLMLESLVGAVALLFAGTAGALGVGRGLRPLTEVTDTALAVAGEVAAGGGGSGSAAGADPGGLGRRVPAGAPGTEVGRLAEAFNTMLTAVQTEVAGRQESEQRMRQFLADASHELRTPLTSLRGYAELITMRERRDGVQREPESADALRRITDEGARMSRLVNDLLVLARSDDDRPDGVGPAGGPDARVALDELAVDAVADLRAAHPGRSITLSAHPVGVVSGDPDQLRQVLANLLTNAAVHTEGDIRVEIDRVDGHVLATVADDGPGLTAPQATHAFDRFWRADKARTRVKGGSGLGLSIVDTLVRAHGGHIAFDTSTTAGTTVTVRIPAHP